MAWRKSWWAKAIFSSSAFLFGSARKKRAYRPRLEMLEDRNLLSTFTVDHLADDMVGSGLNGSLRYAITNAVDNDTIMFGVTGTINLTGALPGLAHSISIEGPGADQLTVRRDIGGYYRIFTVGFGSMVSIDGLTISNGEVYGDYGGGIYNGGTLTVSNSTLSGNTSDYGGGIFNHGTLTVTGSTLSGNFASGYDFDNGGGGIYNYEGMLTVSNSTLSGNSATDGGGGIYNSYGTLTVSNSTLSGNNYAAIANLHGTLTLSNSIVAGNAGDPLSGFIDANHNLIGGNPLLGPLQDNGGPTKTRALLADSPALNAGDTAQLGVADQRGVVRSGGVNIGAYQASATAFALTAPATATAGTPFDLTVKAVDPFGQTALGYTGRVTFTSADPYGATLPTDYTFAAADQGVHLFPGAATLYTASTSDVTATDTSTGSITGSASLSVNPAAADHLLFLQQPTDTPAGQTLSPVMVEVVDAFGNVETGDNSDTITLSLGTNLSGGTLGGTLSLTVVNGVATFSDLSIDLAGTGYTLHAAIGGGLPDIDSDPFNIT